MDSLRYTDRGGKLLPVGPMLSIEKLQNACDGAARDGRQSAAPVGQFFSEFYVRLRVNTVLFCSCTDPQNDHTQLPFTSM